MKLSSYLYQIGATVLLLAAGQTMANQKAQSVHSMNPVEYMMKGKAYLNENGLKLGVSVMPSGLQYKEIKKGKGRSPKLTDSVLVHYTGTLIDGSIFDSSRAPGRPPSEFAVDGVIKGWSEALQLMKEGDRWQLTVPADIAYGDKDKPAIPGHSVLIFDVELIKVLGPMR